MMQEDFSPEERLLRLIKGKRAQGKGQGDESAGGPGVSSGEKKSRAANSADRPADNRGAGSATVKPGEIPEAQRDTQSDNALLSKPFGAQAPSYLYIISIMIVALLFVGLIASIIMNGGKQELTELQRIVRSLSSDVQKSFSSTNGKISNKATGGGAADSGSQDSSFDKYQEMLNKKTVFAPLTKDLKTQDGSSGQGPTLRELTSELRLVGIMPGDEPQAIIEDKKSGQTFFLKKGDQVVSVEIREISNGKVILGKDEDTIALSL